MLFVVEVFLSYSLCPVYLFGRCLFGFLYQTVGSHYQSFFLRVPERKQAVVRAIEAFEYGRGIRDLSECPMNPDYEFRFYALNMERKWLYDRINRRVSRLISDGLVDEVNELIEKGYNKELPSMKAIGYKEVIGFLDGEYDLFDAKELIMKNTRHYAKRQITWLKRYDFVKWIDINKGETVGEIVDRIMESEDNGQL